MWKKGKEHAIPDALSRFPVDEPTKDDEEAENEMQITINQIVHSAIQEISTNAEENHKSDKLTELISKTAELDPEYKKLKESILNGLPEDKNNWELSIRPYFNVKNNLTVDKDIILCGSRIVIPLKLRKEMLSRLHASHQGIERTKRRARQTIYWPNIDNDITNTCKCCSQCQKYLPSNQ